MLVCVHYIIGCNIADTLRRAAINHISNYNYLCSVPPCSVSLLLCRDLFLFCAVCHAAFIRTPPPQTKTLQTRKVLLYRAALLFQRGKVSENFVSSLSFHI